MQYVLLAFQDGEEGEESPRDAFMRRFERYRAMRQQVGCSIAVSATLTKEEERELLAARARNDTMGD